MSFTVKIVDNDTGKVMEDRSDIVCFIGAFGRDDGVHQISACRTNGFIMCKTLNAAEDAIESMESQNPQIKSARAIIRMTDGAFCEKQNDTDS